MAKSLVYPEAFADKSDIVERHEDAISGAAIVHEHDWHSAAYVIKSYFGDAVNALCELVAEGKFAAAHVAVDNLIADELDVVRSDASASSRWTGSPEKKK